MIIFCFFGPLGFFHSTRPYLSQCFLKSLVEKVFIRPSANILKLEIHSTLSFLSSTSSQIWCYMTSIYFVQFCLFGFCFFGFFINVRIVLLSPNIFIFLTISFHRSLFKKYQIYISSFTPWLILTYSIFEVNMETVRCHLLH